MMPTPGFGRRILILAPHPDDEIAGCCAAIGRARRAGAEIHVLFLTTGIPSPEVLWRWQRRRHGSRVEVRREEARRAAAAVGISPAGFLDCPGRALRCRLRSARDAVGAAIDRLAVDTLWVPAYEGGHQDHDAANALAATLADRARVIEFAVYNAAGGSPRSHVFPWVAGGEHAIALTPAEQALKRRTLSLYRSERSNLRYIGLAREGLRPLAAYDYRRPPHPGRLFYQRFQWLPFAHPRVDFTAPEEVCRAIASAF